MKAGYLIHIVAAMTLGLGVWIFFGKTGELSEDTAALDKPINSTESVEQNTVNKTGTTSFSGNQFDSPLDSERIVINETPTQGNARSGNIAVAPVRVSDPNVLIRDYISAWRNKDKSKLDKVWSSIIACESCLARLVEMMVNKTLEEGMMLELAIKMAALDTNTVLPVFDVMIDPAGNRSAAIILSEKIINNGRPEFVTRIFDVIYNAQQNGYDNFARQLTWVISKLENPEGIQPILDTITGRSGTSEEFSDHVSNVFSKVVYNLPDSTNSARMIAGYYLQANAQEQQELWQVVSHHNDTLVLLAANADQNGQHYDIQKYATAIAGLPNLQAVDGLVKLHMKVEYSPSYLANMLKENVVKNPTIKVLHKLEDYMRDPAVDIESRIFAAEGLLSVRENRQARYILEKVVNNSQYADPELQAYIGGRL